MLVVAVLFWGSDEGEEVRGERRRTGRGQGENKREELSCTIPWNGSEVQRKDEEECDEGDKFLVMNNEAW